MFSQVITQLTAYFRFFTLSGSGLALLICLIWLLIYRPPLFKQPRLWLVALAGAVLGILAVAFVQTPLNILINKLWHEGGGLFLVLLIGLLAALMVGLVQEGAKLVPLLVLRKRRGGTLTEQEGFTVGAVSGFGYAVFETFYVMNFLFASGWNWDVMGNEYPALLLTSWERIAMFGLHMGLSALAGWGLAKGKGLRFYLLAAALHAFAGLMNYLMGTLNFPIVLTELALMIEVVVLTIVLLSMRGENPSKLDGR